MKDKLLNNFSVESNGEIIKVDILETDKGLVIDIKGKTMDVIINGEEFYSKYDKEEYKYIPTHLRSFVEENICSYGEGLRKDGSEIKCDLILEGREYFMILPTKRAKKNHFILRDWLICYELLEDKEGFNKEKEEQKFKEFLNNITMHGYKMQLSHGGNDYDNWYDLEVSINDFSLERVKKCLKLWEEYNDYLVNTYLDGRY